MGTMKLTTNQLRECTASWRSFIFIIFPSIPGYRCSVYPKNRSTLMAYSVYILPPPQELFEESLQRGSLKTAGGYLLILHTFEELSSSSEQLVRLLSRAKDEGDWELCKELARFLTALDETGDTLREALEMVNLRSPQDERGNTSFLFEGSRLRFRIDPRIVPSQMEVIAATSMSKVAVVGVQEVRWIGTRR